MCFPLAVFELGLPISFHKHFLIMSVKKIPPPAWAFFLLVTITTIEDWTLGTSWMTCQMLPLHADNYISKKYYIFTTPTYRRTKLRFHITNIFPSPMIQEPAIVVVHGLAPLTSTDRRQSQRSIKQTARHDRHPYDVSMSTNALSSTTLPLCRKSTS